MSFSAESERKTRRRKRWDFWAVFSLGFLLIFSQLCLLPTARAEKVSSDRRWSAARKARFYHNGRGWAPQHAIRGSSEVVEVRRDQNEKSDDKLYEEEKRLVHTGPNPLHN